MVNAIFGFVQRWAIYGLGAVIVVLALWLGWSRLQLADVREELVTTQAQLENAKDKVLSLETQIILKDVAANALRDRLQERIKETSELSQKLTEIENAGSDQDGSVADVLCRAITGADCVQDDNGEARRQGDQP